MNRFAMLPLIGLLMLAACTQPAREIAGKLAAAVPSTNASGSFEILVSSPGVLVLASPHAVDGRVNTLTEKVGREPAERIHKSVGLKEDYSLFFVTTSGRVFGGEWANPPFAFFHYFLIEIEDSLVLKFHVTNNVLQNVTTDSGRLPYKGQ